jgi:arsenate reductase-like glutaredoxin family protein
VLNKASTTWRELPEKEKQGVDEKKAVALLLAHPTLVKRPVLDRGGELMLGFKADSYAKAFA